MARSAWALDGNHDTHLRGSSLAIVRDADYVTQAIRTKLLLYQGEWYLNLKAGVPWFQEIFVAPANIGRADELIQAEILSVEGVQYLSKYDSSFDAGVRSLTVTFDAVTDFGETGETEVVI